MCDVETKIEYSGVTSVEEKYNKHPGKYQFQQTSTLPMLPYSRALALAALSGPQRCMGAWFPQQASRITPIRSSLQLLLELFMHHTWSTSQRSCSPRTSKLYSCWYSKKVNETYLTTGNKNGVCLWPMHWVYIMTATTSLNTKFQMKCPSNFLYIILICRK